MNMKFDKETYSADDQSASNTKSPDNKAKKKKIILWLIVFGVLIWGVKKIQPGTEGNGTDNEVEVMISVQRTGNVLTNIGNLEVWIDDEKVFEVDGNSTNSVVIKMPVGKHTIQTKGQGDKSKKVKFEVTEDGKNEFYFSTQISNWYGVKLEKQNYIPEK